jgi:hypothetical protein
MLAFGLGVGLGMLPTMQLTLIQQAIAALRQIDGAHVYLPGEGSVFGLRAGNYTDSAGTLPGVLDSPVGLVVDALSVLGPELFTGFPGGIDTWVDNGNGSWSIDGTQTSNQDLNADSSLNATLDVNLQWSFTITALNGGIVQTFASKTSPNTFETVGLKSITQPYTSALVRFRVPPGVVATISNISVREISGIHASQNTTADKPVLRRGVVNLLTYSQDIQNAAWSSGSVTTGTNNRITRNATTTNEAAVLRQSTGPITVAGRSYTMAVIATAGNAGTKLYLRDLRCESSGLTIEEVISYFDLTSGVASSGSLHVGKISIVAVENGAYLCVINGVCSATSPANRLDVGLTSSGTVGGTAGDYLFVNNVAVFEGTYTAQQIQALGGIPLTTTAPVSTTFGAYKWDFDTTDRLQLTLPAGYENATIIDATSAGPVTLLEQNVTGTYGIVGGLTDSGELVTNGTFDTGIAPWFDLHGNGSVSWLPEGKLSTVDTGPDGLATYNLGPNLAGKLLKVTLTITGSTGFCCLGGISPVNYSQFDNRRLPVGTHTYVARLGAGEPNYGITLGSVDGGTVIFDNISVREILPSTHGRIILRDTPTPRQLELCQGLANRLANVVPNPWTPALLFAAGEQGAWYDPSDFSTLYQDAAGTVPVTDVGQPVGKILDKSGRGHHATQTTATKRPLLQRDEFARYYLRFDGVDDALVTNSIDFTATDKMTVVAGVRKLNTVAGFNSLVETGTNGINGFGVFTPDSNNSNYSFFLKSNSRPTDNNYVSPITNVIDVQYDCSLAISLQAKARINGTSVSTGNAGLAVSGPFANEPIYIGSRAGTSLPFNGNLYSLIIRGAQSSEAQIASAETYVNSKTGAY